jgi:glucose dehydrogenase
MQAGNFENQRYSTLNQINKKNVKDMKVAWTFSTGVLRGHEGGPLVIGDTLFVHSPFPNKVFAIDLETQKIKWKYEPKQDPSVIPVMCCDTVNRGLAYAEGKVFLQQADTTLVALDSPRPARHCGRSRTATRRSVKRSTPRHRTSSRTRSSPAFPAANSACAASLLPTTSTPASRSGRATAPAPTQKC